MAVGDAPVLEALADITAVSVARRELDPQSLMLVRLAVLIAVDAPASSDVLHVDSWVPRGGLEVARRNSRADTQ
jgi:hypothetical protein